MRELTLRGGYLDSLSDHELQRWIEKEIAYAADALRHDRPGAAMYQAEIAKLMREQERRKAH